MGIGKETKIVITILKKMWEESVYTKLRLIIQHNNQDCVIVVEGQTHGSMEQNKEPRNRLTQIYPTDFLQRYNQFNEGKILPFQQQVLYSKN